MLRVQSSKYENLIICIDLATCSLSVFMSSFLTFLYFKYTSIKKSFPCQLIVTMAILDVITWTIRIIATIYRINVGMTFEVKERNLCILSGFLFSFINLITFLIILVISFGIYSQSHLSINISNFKMTCTSLIIFPSFILSIIPIFTQSYGEIDHIKCWIKDRTILLITFYVPLWLVFVSTAFFILSAIFKLKRLPINFLSEKKLIYKISLFPIIMFICWTPSSIYRVLNSDFIYLEILTYMVVPLQGVLNPIAFGLINERIEKKMKAFFCCNCTEMNDNITDGENEINSFNTLTANNIGLEEVDNEEVNTINKESYLSEF